MERLKVLDTENCIVVADNKARGEKRAKGSKMSTPPRKKLADISNLQQLPRPSNPEAKPHQTFSAVTSDYIDKLHKENMTLMKVLVERNKIIELNGIELQKLRINLQKVQQQNSQLAQANSQMLAELNSGKDKLRALQHELGCKNGLLKARKIILESKAKTVTRVTSENQVGADKRDEAGKFIEAEEADKKPSNSSRRGRPSKNKSLESSTIKPVQAKEKIDNKRFSSGRQSGFQSEEPEQTQKRVHTRRQSALFKSEGPKPPENVFEIDEVKFPASLHDELVHESCPTSSNLSVKKENEEGNLDVKDETQGARRHSGRPSRQASVKVQSYKEIPINLKMRREE